MKFGYKKIEKGRVPPFPIKIYKRIMKIIKNGQTAPVYSVVINRAFERMKLRVQSWETQSY